MKTSSLVVSVAALVLGGALSGCVVAPVGYAEPPAVAPAGVVYVAPVGVAPAPGYSWRYHAEFGWGWWHPEHGWHRGWR